MPPVPNPPVALTLLHSNPASHHVSSERFVATSGLVYRLFTAIPRNAPQQGGSKVLYMLDGNTAFNALTESQLAASPDLTIVAIGYDTELGFDFDARSRDYTPKPLSGSGLPEGSGRPERPSGGAADFLGVLTDEIIAHVESTMPADVATRTLWGHSYGGLFALFALSQGCTAFSRMAIASPSQWWDGGAILRDIANAPMAGIEALVLSRGDSEKRVEGLEDSFAALADFLSAKLDVSVHTLAGATHRIALDASIPLALKLAQTPVRNKR